MALLSTSQHPDREPAQAARAARLALVLARVRFPAHRWELVACAIDEAWDVVSWREMEALPAGVYRDIRHVVRVLGTREVRARIGS